MDSPLKGKVISSAYRDDMSCRFIFTDGTKMVIVSTQQQWITISDGDGEEIEIEGE